MPPPPPPPPPNPNTPSGIHPLKNVAIGVATTVLASALVYFLGFHNPHADDDEVRVRKEASIEAWNSLMFYEKEFRETASRMACQGDTADFEKGIISEYEKIIGNISNIEKETHVDNRLISLIDRRLETLKDKKKATADYYTTYYSMGGINDEDTAKIKLYNDFFSKISVLDGQDTSFINGVSDELKKKYHVNFNLPGPFIVKYEFLVGSWTVDRGKYLTLNKDSTFTFTVDLKNYPGKWSLDGLTIHFNFYDGSSIDYTIKSGSDTFLYATDSNGGPHFLCR